MVKSYMRYEHVKSFGVIAGKSNIVWIPSKENQNSKTTGCLVTSGLEKINIWNIKKEELCNELGYEYVFGAYNSPLKSPAAVTYLSYFEKTELLATGYADGSVKIWDLKSNSILMNFEGHTSAITVLKFDTTGTRLLSGSMDCKINMWDLVSEEGVFKFVGHKNQIVGLDFINQKNDIIHNFENYIISLSKDGEMKIWDVKSLQCIETCLAHTNEAWAFGINDTHDIVITTGNKDQIGIWSIDFSNDKLKLKSLDVISKKSKSRGVSISFKNLKISDYTYETFCIQNADKTIEFFKIKSESELKKTIAKKKKNLREKNFSENEILTYLKQNEVKLKIEELYVLQTNYKITSFSWIKTSPRNVELALTLANNTIEHYTLVKPDELQSGKKFDFKFTKDYVVETLGHRTDIRSIDISSDNKTILTASDGQLKVWNIKTFDVVRTITLESGYALCCKFLPGNTLAIIGFKNGNLELYDLVTSTLLDSVVGAHGTSFYNEMESDSNKKNFKESPIWSLDITHDGKSLITGGNDKLIKLWAFEVQKKIDNETKLTTDTIKVVFDKMLKLDDEVLFVKVSNDKKFLAVSLLNNIVQVLYLDTLSLFLSLYGHKLPVLTMDISSDSKLIITGSADKNIRIWGLDFGNCHKSIFAHTDSIMCLKFISESHNFFSSSKDGMIKYWDAEKFECIQKLAAHQSHVWCLAVSLDGSLMVSASHDKSIRLWNVTDEDVFLVEEKEKELEQLYDEELKFQKSIQNNESTILAASSELIQSSKSAEKLIDALDLAFMHIEDHPLNSYLSYDKNKYTNTSKDLTQSSSLLNALNLSPQEYVLSVFSKIIPHHLDDTLIVLPFSSVLKLLVFIEMWTSVSTIKKNLFYISSICRSLFFLLIVNQKQFAAQSSPYLKNLFYSIKENIRTELKSALETFGYNSEGLLFIKKSFFSSPTILSTEYSHSSSSSLKRSYVTI